MSNGNGQGALALEDAVRQILRTPEKRREFREKWPMYDVAALEKSITQADKDIAQFEEAILKAQRLKREWTDLVSQCKRRDIALRNMAN